MNETLALQRLNLYRRAAALLASSLRFDETLDHVIAACLPALGDFGFFDVVFEDDVKRTARAFESPRVEDLLRPTRWVRQERTDMNLCALSTGRAALHPDIDDAWYRAVAVNEPHLDLLRQLAFRSMITVPMRFGDELIGSLTLFMSHSGRRHAAEDLAFAEELAALAAPTVANVRLLETRRRAELALRGSEERLRLAVDAGRMGTWDWDIVDDRVTWSERVYELHGLSPGAFGGRVEDFAALVHPEDLPQVQRDIDRALSGGGTYVAEFRAPQPDGSVRWLATRANVSRDEQGRPVRMVGATYDVTERVTLLQAERQAREEAERARAEAERANRAKDEFLAMLGHELRNPLAPIVTALHLMEMRAPDTLAYERAIVERQVRHLSRLVDDLLDVARIAQGKIELRPERLDLADIARKAVEQVRPLLEKRRHRFELDLPPDPLPVRGDAVRLAQIVSNLLHNAAKFTEPGGVVALRLSAEARGVVLRVEDSGIGLTAELLERLFEPFTQGPQPTDRQTGGLGLGLAIARTLTRLHGGDLRAESDGPGRGSAFELRLPPAAPAAAEAEPAATVRPARSGRILVVDDNLDAGETLARCLELEGFTVGFAPDGPGALALAERFRPDVAILDIGLPGMDGFELAERLLDRPGRRNIRLVALSGYGREPDQQRARRAGFDLHLVKPVETEHLLESLACLLQDERGDRPPGP